MESRATAPLRRTRRVAIALAAILGALIASALSFTAESQSASANVAAGGSNVLYTLTEGAPVPVGVRSLRYTTAIGTNGRISGLQAPAWTPTPGTTGEVSRGGDLYVVDARKATRVVHVSLHITNLAALAHAYSALLLPVGVWSSTAAATTSDWRRASTKPLFLTHTDGSLTLALAPGAMYDITIDAGGTWAAWAASAGGSGTYAPAFYATVR